MQAEYSPWDEFNDGALSADGALEQPFSRVSRCVARLSVFRVSKGTAATHARSSLEFMPQA